jgi:hypothetical protein
MNLDVQGGIARRTRYSPFVRPPSIEAIAPWIIRSIRAEIAAAIEAPSSDTVVVDFT